MKQIEKPVAITFSKGLKLATIVTNGSRTAIYTDKGRTFAPKLSTAIARLEAKGWQLIPDRFV